MAANEKTNTEVMKEKFEGRELTPEQLEDVAGGLEKETILDSKFLNYMLGDKVCRRWDGKVRWNEEPDEMVRKAWEKVGVTFYWKYLESNRYVINGVDVTRKQAFEHAQKVLGKKVKDSDWM
ncbi:MAG: hypothetical protein IKZ66_03875 [Schwartzia sp.]|jgi:hypothetical protein|nr:hypothetical protein [Schwartzia sp. (in: firmicutes)]